MLQTAADQCRQGVWRQPRERRHGFDDLPFCARKLPYLRPEAGLLEHRRVVSAAVPSTVSKDAPPSFWPQSGADPLPALCHCIFEHSRYGGGQKDLYLRSKRNGPRVGSPIAYSLVQSLFLQSTLLMQHFLFACCFCIVGFWLGLYLMVPSVSKFHSAVNASWATSWGEQSRTHASLDALNSCVTFQFLYLQFLFRGHDWWRLLPLKFLVLLMFPG